MIPQPGEQITIYFRNGARVDGEVVSWTNKQYTLQTAGGTATIVIPNGKQDILFYKISTTKSVFETLKNKPNKNQNDIKTLAELKNEMNNVEREQLTEQLCSREPIKVKDNYGLPDFTKHSPINRSREKVAGSSSNFGAELQDLFGQKH